MEEKNYLNEITLRIFLYLLYENESIEIPTTLRIEKENFIKYIFDNELAEIFIIERNGEIFKEIDYKNFLKDDYIDFDLLNEPLKVKLIDKDVLTDLMSKYIGNFRNGNLKSPEDNFYSFSKCILESANLLDPYYKDYGVNFNIGLALNKNKLENKAYDYKIRLLESVLYMSNEKYITINGCNIKKDKANENLIFINVTLNKTFDEILDIEKYWIYSYGDIRINEKDGVAFYKNNRYPAKSTETKAFKLLCHLVKNHGIKVSIEDAYNLFWTDSDKISFDSKKNAIKDSRKEIIKNLKVLQDSQPSFTLTITNEYILLISNPSSINY